MAKKVTLTDSTTGEIVYPQTLVDSVQDENGKLLSALTLMLNNTAAFTPTGDYNPATKKYVDDAIDNAGSGITVSSTAPTNPKAGDIWFEVS